MSVYRWISNGAAIVSGSTYDVVKYDDKIRKQAGLQRTTGTRSEIVAWFPSEDDAVRFAEAFFGGVFRHE